jgi:hypothetical protein
MIPCPNSVSSFFVSNSCAASIAKSICQRKDQCYCWKCKNVVGLWSLLCSLYFCVNWKQNGVGEHKPTQLQCGITQKNKTWIFITPKSSGLFKYESAEIPEVSCDIYLSAWNNVSEKGVKYEDGGLLGCDV